MKKENKNQRKSKSLNPILENIIVGGIFLFIAVIVINTIGYQNIKTWLSSPIVWNDPDYITISLADKKEFDDNIELTFEVKNMSEHLFDNIRAYIYSGHDVMEISSIDNIFPSQSILIEKSVSSEYGNKTFYNYFHNYKLGENELEYHINYLSESSYLSSVDYEDEIQIDCNGWIKILILLLIFGISAFLGFSKKIHNTPLRMIFKFLGMPMAIILLLLYLFVTYGGNNSSSSGSNSSSAQEYTRQATLKAGAEINGNTANAAKAHAQMDNAFADMVGGNNERAKQEYKRQANLKAGAEMHGNKADAARAQAQMDKALADMLNDRNK